MVWGLWFLLGVELLRVLLPMSAFLLRDRLGWPTPWIGVAVLALFAGGWLALPLRRMLDARALLGLAVLLLGAGRAGVQAWLGDPIVDFAAAALGFVGFMLLPPALVELCGSSDASLGRQGPGGDPVLLSGLILGMFYDQFLHGVAGTWDWTWRSGLVAGLIGYGLVAILALSTIGLLRRHGQAHAEGESSSTVLPATVLPATVLPAGWSTIGPLVFLYLVLLGNPARGVAVAGYGDGAAHDVGLGLFGALAGGLLLSRRIVERRWIVPAWAVGSLLLVLVDWLDGTAALLATVGVAVVVGWLVGRALRVKARASSSDGTIAGRLAVVQGWTFLGAGALLFLHGSRLDLNLVDPMVLPLVAMGWLALVAWALGASRADRGARADAGRRTDAEPARAGAPRMPVVLGAAAFGAMVLGTIIVLPSMRVEWPTRPPGDLDSLTVMTYNIHCGVEPLGALDLERQARAIEEADPDVVVLQEVPRGWILSGSADVLGWLARRLRMRSAFAPTGDPLWGDAVLSKLPIRRVERHALPSDGLTIRRGLLEVEIDVSLPGLDAREPVTILATHLHHPNDGGAVRAAQIATILGHWDGRPRTILGGDFNARPDWPELEALRAAGFVDAAAAAAARSGIRPADTFSSLEPFERIDYLWATRDLRVIDARVPRTTASDHLPVVATFSLPVR